MAKMILGKKENLLLALALCVLAQILCTRYGPSGNLWPLWFFFPGIFLFLRSTGKESVPKEEGVQGEWVLFLLIFLLAAFLRLVRLEDIPGGIYYDSGALGLYTLRYLHEGWEPGFMLPSFAANPSFVLYLLAGWFKAVGASPGSLLLFFSLLSLAAFPFIYWTFRTWCGPRTALLALFFLAVMRWHVHFSRDGFRGILILLFMFATLAFLGEAWRGKRTWAFPLAALFLAGGLHTYQAFKAFPLLVLALGIWQARRGGWDLVSHRRPLALAAFLFLVFSFPVLLEWARSGSLGTRESEIFIGKEILRQGSLLPLAVQAARVFALFNLKGDPHPCHNFGNLPELDPVTGILFLLGAALALRDPLKRGHFLALAGFLVLCLPGLLAYEESPLRRILGAAPFTALLAALAGQSLFSRIPAKGAGRRALILLALAGAGALNGWTYFHGQANDSAAYRAHSREATLVGERIHEEPQTRFLLAPAFFFHPTVQFIAYGDRSRVGKLDWEELQGKVLPPGKTCFVLEEGKGPTLEFLRGLLPGGTPEILRDGSGRVLAFFYSIEAPAAPLSFTRGWVGRYYVSLHPDGKPVRVRREPLLNFTQAGDFGVDHRPLSAAWKGRLLLEKGGEYGFQVLTRDEARLCLNGRWFESKALPATLRLGPGIHDLSLEVSRVEDPDVAMPLHLLWKRPGASSYEVVPNSAFGPLRP